MKDIVEGYVSRIECDIENNDLTESDLNDLIRELERMVEEIGLDWVECGNCEKKFFIPKEYEGSLNCPYCRELITNG
jgi:uncharacterized CHY-type Zn-finger protein